MTHFISPDIAGKGTQKKLFMAFGLVTLGLILFFIVKKGILDPMEIE